jgi:putative DNA primase/helicase
MSTATKVGPILGNIPDELKELAQWIVWRNEGRDGERTKIPYQPRYPERRAKTNDPSTWSSFAAAVSVFRSGQWDGIGFVFSPDDPYCGIDFDGCLIAGKLADWARRWIQHLDGAYAEVSPSGRGIKFFCRAKLAGKGGKRTTQADDHTGIEVYDRGRFFAVTGNIWSQEA